MPIYDPFKNMQMPSSTVAAPSTIKATTAAAPKPAAPVAPAPSAPAPVNKTSATTSTSTTGQTGSANTADFLGEGTVGQGSVAAQDRTPQQILQDRYAANNQLNQANAATTAGINSAPGGYTAQRNADVNTALDASNRLGATFVGKAGAELPFLGDVPFVGPIAEGAFTGAQSFATNGAQRMFDNPRETLMTLGTNGAVAGTDALVDNVGTGIIRGATGNDQASFNAPLTPNQLWDPNGPIYSDGTGGDVNLPGIQDIGEGIAQGAEAVIDAAGNLIPQRPQRPGGGGLNGGGAGGMGGGAPGTPGGVFQSATDNAARLRGTTAEGVAPIDPSGQARQEDALDAAMSFMDGPRATQGAMDQANAFQTGPRATQGALGATQGYREGPRDQDAASAAVAGFREGPRATGDALAASNAFREGPRASEAALGSVNQFQAGPRAQDSTRSNVSQFMQQQEGPSRAELLLQKAQQEGMADTLAVARSGRARDAGSQNRALQVAQAEIAGSGVDNARDASLLRAEEEQNFRNQQLDALGIDADLASSLDRGTLEALGLETEIGRGMDTDTLESLRQTGEMSRGLDTDTLTSLQETGRLATSRDEGTRDALRTEADLSRGLDTDTLEAMGITAEMARGLDQDTLEALRQQADLSTAMRDAGVTERGQTLDFTGQMEQTAAGLEGDVIGAIPQMEQVRHDDQYELTPDEKMYLAEMGAAGGALGTIGGPLLKAIFG